MGHARKEQITIFPTNACNMKCIYCAADSARYQGNTQKIDIEFAKIGITDYFKDPNKYQIRYYSSGEPTQAMDIIVETWEYAYKLRGKRLVSEIQTNCYFGKDEAEWLASHITYIWASIDGWPEIQNKNRPLFDGSSTFDKVMENILYLKEHTWVGIRMTITSETIDKQLELIEFFANHGFKYIVSEPVFLPVKNDIVNSPGKITGIDLKTYIKHFIQAWYEAEKMGVTYFNSFMVNFDEEVEYACRSCLPTPHLTTDGYVSACDLGFYGNTPLKHLIYGKYNKEKKVIEYWPDAIKKLRSRKCINMKSCKKCPVAKYCGGGCLGRAYHETRDFYGVIPEYCWATRYLAKHLPVGKMKLPYLHP